MTLASVVAGQQISHNDIDQIINLLTGTMNDQQVTLKGDYATVGTSLILSSKTAATKGGALGFADAGTMKWEWYHHSDQSLNLWDSVRTANALTFLSNGALTITPATTITGDLTESARLIMSAATAKILLGTSGGGFRDSADSLDLLLLDATGLTTHRNAIKVPPSAGGTMAATNYGTIPVKIAESDQTGALVASITFSNLPTGFRNIRWWARARDGSASTSASNLVAQLNGSSTAVYYWQQIGAANATVTAFDVLASASFAAGITTNGAIGDANWFAVSQGVIFDYNGSQKKDGFWDGSLIYGGAHGNIPRYSGGWHWDNTAAVTSITFFSNAAVTTIKALIAIYGEP